PALLVPHLRFCHGPAHSRRRPRGGITEQMYHSYPVARARGERSGRVTGQHRLTRAEMRWTSGFYVTISPRTASHNSHIHHPCSFLCEPPAEAFRREKTA